MVSFYSNNISQILLYLNIFIYYFFYTGFISTFSKKILEKKIFYKTYF